MFDGALQDLCRDIRVYAVAAHQLAGDGHAGDVQFGDAGPKQLSRVRGLSRSAVSSPASTSVSMRCRTWTGAPPTVPSA